MGTLTRASGRAWIVVAIAAVAAAAGAVAAAAKRIKGPLNDTFQGHIAATGGDLSGERGRAVIVLRPGIGSPRRTVKITITGTQCVYANPHCVRLTGTLRGTITRQTTLPDIGARFAVKATGTVEPLGHVSAKGTAHGTGFIVRGEETLRLRLATPSGSVTLDAHSATVPGFTSP